MAEVALKSIETFRIKDADDNYYGGNQKWLVGKEFHKEAACGATTCANILAYLSYHYEGYDGICDFDISKKDEFTELMKAIYPYVKPGLVGIMPADYIKGAVEYSKDKGIELTSDLLTVPATQSKRPSFEYMSRWIAAAIEEDSPVAFLNLSSGRVKNLDGYHWVTIVAIDVEAGMVKIVDNGRLLDVNIAKWLKRSTMGGAFVIIEAS